MRKIIAAALLSLFISTPIIAADNVTVFLAFVFYRDKTNNSQRTIIIGGATLKECQEVFKVFLSGVGPEVEDFSVAACNAYVLTNSSRS